MQLLQTSYSYLAKSKLSFNIAVKFCFLGRSKLFVLITLKSSKGHNQWRSCFIKKIGWCDLFCFRPWYIETARPDPKHVLILLDTSRSMRQPLHSRRKIDVAVEAVESLLETLTPYDRVRMLHCDWICDATVDWFCVLTNQPNVLKRNNNVLKNAIICLLTSFFGSLMIYKLKWSSHVSSHIQGRRQDFAAGGPITRRRGQKPEGGGHIFKILY